MAGANPKRRHLTLKQIEKRLEALPMLPAVITQLTSISPDSPEFSDQIEELLHSDPALTSRLLSLANKSSTASCSPVTTISEAMVRVGSVRLLEMLTSLTVLKIFMPVTQGQRNLWLHALHVAEAAKLLAQRFLDARVDPEQAYLAGLMHDIGRFIMFQHDSSELGEVDELGYKTPQDLIKAEKAICGYEHTQLGEFACQAWGFPPELTLLIKEHHQYEHDVLSEFELHLQYLITVVQIADELSLSYLLIPHDPETLTENIQSWLGKYLERPGLHLSNIDAELLAGMVPQVEQDTHHLAEFLGLAHNN